MASTVFERRPPAAGAAEAALAGARHVPFWLDDLGPQPVRPPLVGDTDCGLAVVGGGFMGLWTALLAKEADPGLDVVLLESHTVGWAASGRNGGFCEASLTHGEENGRSRFGDEYDRLAELGRENLDEIEATVARLHLDCDWARPGSLTVAVEPYQAEELRSAAEEAAGAGAEFLDADAVRARLNSPTYLAGLHEPGDTALVHPAKLAAELARAAEAAGVRIVEHSPVTELRRGTAGEPEVLHTDRGRVRADRVVLATNVFPSLLRRNRRYTVPVYDYVMVTEPLGDEQLAAIGWDGREGVADCGNQFHYYRMTADRRILWGGYDAVYHPGRRVRSRYEDRPATHRKLAEHFLTTFPQLAGIRFTHAWAGAIDTCSRFCAFYGTAHDGRVAYAAGFTGLGVGATRFAGKVVLDLLSGRETELTRLRMVRTRPIPFPPEPLATIGIQATRWSLDRADHHEGRRNPFLRALDAVGMGFDS